jgi:ABC-2 type transport system permease protein/capsular polysaccharide transport system permease protein
VIGALLMREILTRFGRHNIGFLWLFVEPMLFTLGVTALWTITKSVHGSNLPIVAFALTGYSSVLLWRNMPSRCIAAIEPNLSLLYHRYVKIIDIFAARLLLEGGGATISFVTLGCFFVFIGWLNPPEDVLEVAFAWTLLAWFGAALAIFLGSLSEENEIVEKLWHPTQYLMFPLSGAAFMVDALPKAAQDVLLYLPMVHGVEMIREGYFGSKFKAHYDVPYLVIFCMCLTVLALAQTRKISRTVIPE